MFDLIKRATSTAKSVLNSNPKRTAYGIAASAVAVVAGTVSASTTTALATPTWGPTDIVNTVATQVYPAVIPCLTVGATVFVAFWIYHRVRGAL